MRTVYLQDHSSINLMVKTDWNRLQLRTPKSGGVQFAEELNIYMDLRHFPHRLLRQEEGNQKLHGGERRQLPDWITEVSIANEEQVTTSCGLQMWHSIWAHTI